jgi:hypothetical protein
MYYIKCNNINKGNIKKPYLFRILLKLLVNLQHPNALNIIKLDENYKPPLIF